MKARLTTLFCLLLALTLSLAGGFYSMASLPSSPPPPGVNGETTIEVPVEIIPSSSSGSQLLQEDTIATIVSEQLELSSGATPYLKASVKVLYDDNGQPDYLVVYLPHRQSWLFETVKIELGENYDVLAVEKDYVEQENDLYEEQSIAATCPDNDVQIVLGCTTTEFPSSVTATNNSYNAAVAAGYETVKLLGSQENTTAVKNWLSCPNLLYYGRIGHGNSSGILLYDGSLTVSNYWDSMASQLPGKILYFNSCEVFNNPLKTSIFNTGVAKFIGGICSLWVGTSEPVWQCWNQHNFVQDPPPGSQEDEMCYWSQQCESDMNYPDPGCHGCGGPGPHVFPEPGPPGPTPTPSNTPTPAPVAPILLVDDDAGKSYQNYYTAALNALGKSYDTWTVQSQGSPSAATLQQYGIVIWFTGDDYTTTLTSTDQSNLTTYLNGGGKLFITGQDIGYDITGSSFYSNYLHASYVRDDTNTYGLTGYDILSGVNVNISGGDGANNQSYPSEIGLGSGAVGLYDYDGSYGWGGLRWEGAYKVVYLSFGYEAINAAASRSSVMNAVLNWLEGGAPPPTPTPTNTPTPTGVPPTPTPTTPSSTVFSDDFETNKGWTRNPNGSDTATTGLWERANPEGTSYSGDKQLGTTHSGSYDLVTGPLAGSSVGSYDIDGGVTTIRSPNITLPSSGNLTLSFYYYLSHYSNSSSADYLRVKVVGSTTQTVFEELGAANDDDAVWDYFSTSLNSFAGQTVYLLIEAADASTASLVEAAVDDVLITSN